MLAISNYFVYGGSSSPVGPARPDWADATPRKPRPRLTCVGMSASVTILPFALKLVTACAVCIAYVLVALRAMLGMAQWLGSYLAARVGRVVARQGEQWWQATLEVEFGGIGEAAEVIECGDGIHAGRFRPKRGGRQEARC